MKMKDMRKLSKMFQPNPADPEIAGAIYMVRYLLTGDSSKLPPLVQAAVLKIEKNED